MGCRILVAVSGGPDSIALLLALLELGREVLAVHYDHALRPASAAESEQVAVVCRRLGVQLLRGGRSAPLASGSIQAAARAARYGFLQDAREEVGADLVALAHTADDVVEGAALHLLRGSGLAGMRGMPVRRAFYVRPLLEVWRRDVIGFLEARSESWLNDPSNFNLAHARVRLRQEILPRLERDRPGILHRFRGAARAAARIQDGLEREANRLIGAGVRIAVKDLAGVSSPTRAEVFRQLYLRSGGPMPGLSRRHLGAIERLVDGGAPDAEVHLPAGLSCVRSADRLEFLPRNERSEEAPSEVNLRVWPCTGCSAPDAVHLRPGLRLEVGRRSPGLRMRPSGGRGTRKLQDVLVDARVPRRVRDRLPLVFANGRLAWVPGVAVDRDLVVAPGQPGWHVTLVQGIRDACWSRNEVQWGGSQPEDPKTLC